MGLNLRICLHEFSIHLLVSCSLLPRLKPFLVLKCENVIDTDVFYEKIIFADELYKYSFENINYLTIDEIVRIINRHIIKTNDSVVGCINQPLHKIECYKMKYQQFFLVKICVDKTIVYIGRIDI